MSLTDGRNGPTELAAGAEEMDLPPSSLSGGIPRIRLRTFDGNVAGYKEWRREVKATRMMFNIKDEQLAGMIYLALEPGEGKPRDLMADLEIEEVCTAEGLQKMWKVLDAEYTRDVHVRSDEAQSRYERCRRVPGQAMDVFIREAKLARRVLAKEDPGTTISDVSFARTLLRKSGLNRLEQRAVLSAAGAQWDLQKIEDGLKLMYGDAHVDDRRRMG